MLINYREYIKRNSEIEKKNIFKENIFLYQINK